MYYMTDAITLDMRGPVDNRINAIKARLGSLSPKAMSMLPPTAGKALLTEDLPWLLKELEEARDHLNTFCKCPTHGPSLVQLDPDDFEEDVMTLEAELNSLREEYDRIDHMGLDQSIITRKIGDIQGKLFVLTGREL